MYFDSTPMGLRQMRMDAKIKRVYAEASQDIQQKIDKYTKRFKALDADWQQRVKEGKATKAEYDTWKAYQVFIGKRWESVRDDILQQIYNSNETASRIINGEKRAIFVEAVNHAEYSIDKDFSFGISFNLYDSATLTRILRDDPQILPEVSTDPDRDYVWGRKQITSAITQGFIQGESIPEIGKRIGEKLGSSSQKHMQRLARTAMNSAQNAGRIEAMYNAKEMGIKVQKMWIATLDNRTRDSHQDLDGQVQDVDKPFESMLGDILFPGDPDADPANVWNCRCALGYEYPEYKNQYDERGAKNDDGEDEIIPYMTYKEWSNWKATGEMPKREQPVVSIYDPKGYKPDKYDEHYKQIAQEKAAYKKQVDDYVKQLDREESELFIEYKELENAKKGIQYISIYDKFKTEKELTTYESTLQNNLSDISDQIENLANEWRQRRREGFATDEESDKAFSEYLEKRQQLLNKHEEMLTELNSLYKLNWKDVEQIRKYSGNDEAMQNRMQAIKDRQTAINKEQVDMYDKMAEHNRKLETSYTIEKIVSDMQSKNVEWRTPQKLTGKFDFNSVVDRLGGGDLTRGSCASLSLCYVGQKAGYDVIDFRGGESLNTFCHNTRAVMRSLIENGKAAIKTEAASSLTAAKKAMKQMEDGKEYILITGRHASVVKQEKGEYYYLELQSGRQGENGWNSFSKYGLEETLKWRFDAKSRGKYDVGEAFLADVDDMSKNERLLKILGYINTDPDKQKKGSAGSVK